MHKGTDVWTGKLVCSSCGQEYSIRKGIADFLLKKTEEIESERKGWMEFSKGETKEFVEQLPFPKNVPEKEKTHWTQQADNFFQAIELLGVNGSEKVLDIGAGRCWSTREFAKKNCNVVALDIVEKKFFGLECGEFFIKDDLFFERVLADMHSLPFPSNSFDIVFSTASFHHSSDLEKLFSEAARVLKKGGRLALTNEPVRGLFDSRKIDLREKELGINEHKPSFFEWNSAIKKNCLEPRYFFPRSIERMLESGNVNAEKKYKLLLGRFGAKAAGVKAIRRIILRLNIPMQLLLGANIVCIARKK